MERQRRKREESCKGTAAPMPLGYRHHPDASEGRSFSTQEVEPPHLLKQEEQKSFARIRNQPAHQPQVDEEAVEQRHHHQGNTTPEWRLEFLGKELHIHIQNVRRTDDEHHAGDIRAQL